MDKKKINSDIDEVINLIKANSKDAHYADTLIDKLMSLKGQYDVEPVRLEIKESDVLKEYDFESFRLLKCKGGNAFQMKGGLLTYVTPRSANLYELLNTLFDIKDNQENWSEDDRKTYDTLFSATFYILSAPSFCAIDDKIFFGVAANIIKLLNEFVEKSNNAELKDETPKENAEFEAKNDALNEMFKEGEK